MQNRYLAISAAHEVLGPECVLCTDQETEVQRVLSKLPEVPHGFRKRRGQDSKLGLSRGSQSAELHSCTHVQAHIHMSTVLYSGPGPEETRRVYKKRSLENLLCLCLGVPA